jgi:hypothetical protein
MTREETLEAIKVMQHYADGGEVEASKNEWIDSYLNNDPDWDWIVNDYRIKKTTKKIKLEAWIDVCGELRWFSEREDSPENCHVRLPSEDKWVEVEE